MTSFFIETGFYFCMYALFFWLGYKIGHLDGYIYSSKKFLKLLDECIKKPD